MAIGTDTAYQTMYIFISVICILSLIRLEMKKSISINGEWGILKTNPASVGYSDMIYDQTVLGMDYLDCSGQTLSRIVFKIKGHSGHIVDLHGNHSSFSTIFVSSN